MQTIRSFISIPVTPQVTGGAKRIIEKLRPLDDGIKWVPTDNFHLTLKFLGDVNNTEIPAVCKVIRGACKNVEPFELRFVGTGGFPNLERPRILYIGIDDPPSRWSP